MTPERSGALALGLGMAGVAGAFLLSDLPTPWRAGFGLACAVGAVLTRGWVERTRGPAIAGTLLLALAAWLSFQPD